MLKGCYYINNRARFYFYEYLDSQMISLQYRVWYKNWFGKTRYKWINAIEGSKEIIEGSKESKEYDIDYLDVLTPDILNKLFKLYKDDRKKQEIEIKQRKRIQRQNQKLLKRCTK